MLGLNKPYRSTSDFAKEFLQSGNPVKLIGLYDSSKEEGRTIEEMDAEELRQFIKIRNEEKFWVTLDGGYPPKSKSNLHIPGAKDDSGKSEEFTGGSVSYYTVQISNPRSGGDSYTAECNDIIEALQMNYAQGNAFKAIWRTCAAKLGKTKKGMLTGVYDAEKVIFFGERMLAQEKLDSYRKGKQANS